MKLIFTPQVEIDYTIKRQRISVAAENIDEISHHIVEKKFTMEDVKMFLILTKVSSIELDHKVIKIIHQENNLSVVP